MRPYATVATARRAFYAVTAARWLPTGLILPTMVLYMAGRGLSLTEAGVVFAFHGAVVLTLELPTGGLADALGRRAVLLAGAALAVSSAALMLAAHSVGGFLLAWGVNGVFRALDSGPLEAWYVDTALAADPERDLERDLSGGTVALYGAVGIGSLLATAGTLAPGLPGDPLTLTFALALAFEVVHLLAVLFLVRERRPGQGLRVALRAAAAAPRVVREAAVLAWRSRALRLVLAVELTWGAGLTAVELLWQPRLAAAAGDTDNTLLLGLTSASGWIAGALGGALLPLLVRLARGSTVRAAALLRVAQGLAVVALALTGGPALVLAGYVGFYVVHGAANPAHFALLHRMVTSAHRTTVLSVNSLVSRAGGLPASVLFGALADAARPGRAFALAAVLLALGAPLYLLAGDPPAPARAGPA